MYIDKNQINTEKPNRIQIATVKDQFDIMVYSHTSISFSDVYQSLQIFLGFKPILNHDLCVITQGLLKSDGPLTLLLHITQKATRKNRGSGF